MSPDQLFPHLRGTLPQNYYYANGIDNSGGILDFALVPGEQIGLDNNYKYAVFPNGRVEQAYEPIWDSEPAKRVYYSESQLRQRGVDFSDAKVDTHGVATPAGYTVAGDFKTNDGGANILGIIGFTALTFGFGAAVAAPATAEAATASASVATEGTVNGLEIATGGVADEGFDAIAATEGAGDYASGLEISTGGVADEGYGSISSGGFSDYISKAASAIGLARQVAASGKSAPKPAAQRNAGVYSEPWQHPAQYKEGATPAPSSNANSIITALVLFVVAAIAFKLFAR